MGYIVWLVIGAIYVLGSSSSIWWFLMWAAIPWLAVAIVFCVVFALSIVFDAPFDADD